MVHARGQDTYRAAKDLKSILKLAPNNADAVQSLVSTKSLAIHSQASIQSEPVWPRIKDLKSILKLAPNNANAVQSLVSAEALTLLEPVLPFFFFPFWSLKRHGHIRPCLFRLDSLSPCGLPSWRRPKCCCTRGTRGPGPGHQGCPQTENSPSPLHFAMPQASFPLSSWLAILVQALPDSLSLSLLLTCHPCAGPGMIPSLLLTCHHCAGPNAAATRGS